MADVLRRVDDKIEAHYITRAIELFTDMEQYKEFKCSLSVKHRCQTITAEAVQSVRGGVTTIFDIQPEGAGWAVYAGFVDGKVCKFAKTPFTVEDGKVSDKMRELVITYINEETSPDVIDRFDDFAQRLAERELDS